MSYKRMAEQERSLEAEVKAWLDQAQAADAAEDAQHGADHRGDETPAWMVDTGGAGRARHQDRSACGVVFPAC
jgi:hypothetical protein